MLVIKKASNKNQLSLVAQAVFQAILSSAVACGGGTDPEPETQVAPTVSISAPSDVRNVHDSFNVALTGADVNGNQNPAYGNWTSEDGSTGGLNEGSNTILINAVGSDSNNDGVINMSYEASVDDSTGLTGSNSASNSIAINGNDIAPNQTYFRITVTTIEPLWLLAIVITKL